MNGGAVSEDKSALIPTRAISFRNGAQPLGAVFSLIIDGTCS